VFCSDARVYSYSFDGKAKVMKSFLEISRTLTKGGILAIREFFVLMSNMLKSNYYLKKQKNFQKNLLGNLGIILIKS